jgi:chromosome partitioning protein
MTMKITAVVNQKGGVGKTATTVNVGGALAARGRRVLLVDLDPQGHLTDALKLPTAEPPATLAAALTGEYTGDPAALVVVYEGAGGLLAVMPNALEMFTVARELDKLRAREERLARVLGPLAAMFDHGLLDCPPSLDILTDNALNAADGVLIPVQAEDSSLRALRLLLGQVNALEAELRRTPLDLHGLVVSMIDKGKGGRPRSKLAQSVIESYESLPLPILATVPRGVPVTEAWRYGRLVVDYAPDSEHAEAYHALARVLDGAA